MSRDERAWASVKFEQIPLFYPRGWAAPLRRISPIATLERFCCLLLIRADYIRQRPRARPRMHWELLKLLRFIRIYLFQVFWPKLANPWIGHPSKPQKRNELRLGLNFCHAMVPFQFHKSHSYLHEIGCFFATVSCAEKTSRYLLGQLMAHLANLV